MSYEGFDQIICQNGHFFSVDAHASPDERRCHECGTDPAWCNMVDDTNCDAFGIIPDSDMARFLIQDAKLQKCECCGHVKELEPAKYRIPTKEETAALRCFIVCDTAAKIGKHYVRIKA